MGNTQSPNLQKSTFTLLTPGKHPWFDREHIVWMDEVEAQRSTRIRKGDFTPDYHRTVSKHLVFFFPNNNSYLV